MKMIRKTIIKRDHKLVDYDRFRISLKKLQDKKDRKLSDEKEIFKVRVYPVPLEIKGLRCFLAAQNLLTSSSIRFYYLVGVSIGSGDS